MEKRYSAKEPRVTEHEELDPWPGYISMRKEGRGSDANSAQEGPVTRESWTWELRLSIRTSRSKMSRWRSWMPISSGSGQVPSYRRMRLGLSQTWGRGLVYVVCFTCYSHSVIVYCCFTALCSSNVVLFTTRMLGLQCRKQHKLQTLSVGIDIVVTGCRPSISKNLLITLEGKCFLFWRGECQGFLPRSPSED